MYVIVSGVSLQQHLLLSLLSGMLVLHHTLFDPPCQQTWPAPVNNKMKVLEMAMIYDVTNLRREDREPSGHIGPVLHEMFGLEDCWFIQFSVKCTNQVYK